MFIFQALKTAQSGLPAYAQEMISAGKAKEVVAAYRSTATGKEYHRHILQREDGKVFDPMMNSNPGSESAWTTQDKWKARLGLDQGKFEFSFGGKAEEKQAAKQPEQNAFMGNPKPKAVKIALKQVPKKVKQEIRTYEQHVKALESQPVFEGSATFGNEWKSFLKAASEKKYGGKSIIDIAYEKGKKHDVDPKLVLAYIYVESRGVPDKPSKEYEYVADAEGKKQKQLKPDNMQSWGLMQLIPGLQGLTIQEAKNPSINIDRGTAYIAANLKAYPGKAPIQILGYNRGTRGAGKFEENGYAGKTEKNTAAANTYVASVLQAYSLLSESKFDSHKSESAGAFIKSQDYQSAMERCQKKTDGGYLAGFDFSQGFNYP